MRRGAVPSQPFVDIVKARYEELGDDPSTVKQLAFELGVTPSTAYRYTNRGGETMDFDVADRIVTRLLGPMAWYEEPHLAEIYQAVDLNSLDYGVPTSKVVAEENRRNVLAALREEGNEQRAADKLGISLSAVRTYRHMRRAA